MGLFKITMKKDNDKKDNEKRPVDKYSQIEQGTQEPELKVPIPSSNNLTEINNISDKIDKVLSNQTIIVENQQYILNAIVGTQELIKSLASDNTEETAPEPTEEEIREAMEEIKKKKQSAVVKGKKK